MDKQSFIEKYGDVEVRALSWKQPFASLMVHGKIETRVWPSSYFGWVLICASQKPYTDNDILLIAGNEQYGRIHTVRPKEIHGQAIAIGKLKGSRAMTPADSDSCFVEYVSPWLSHRKDGSYVEKQLWCHIYEDVQPIVPFPWKGTQGWKTIDQETKSKIILM